MDTLIHPYGRQGTPHLVVCRLGRRVDEVVADRSGDQRGVLLHVGDACSQVVECPLVERPAVEHDLAAIRS